MPVTATFSWTGTGSPDRRTTDLTLHTADRVVRSRTTGNTRDATVTGSLSINGQVFSPNDADDRFANIVATTQASLAILHR